MEGSLKVPEMPSIGGEVSGSMPDVSGDVSMPSVDVDMPSGSMDVSGE